MQRITEKVVNATVTFQHTKMLEMMKTVKLIINT